MMPFWTLTAVCFEHHHHHPFFSIGPPQLLQLLTVFAQIAVGIDYMHMKRCLHRDIKSDNIFLWHKPSELRRPQLGPAFLLLLKALSSRAASKYKSAPPLSLKFEPSLPLPLFYSKGSSGNIRIMLGDMGISRHINPASGELAETFCGTPLYMAPELVRKGYGFRSSGPDGYDFKADVWSLGVLLYEMYCGKDKAKLFD